MGAKDIKKNNIHVPRANFDLPEWGNANLEEKLQLLGERDETAFVKGRFTLFKD